MASELVKATLNATWTDVAGAAASVAGIFWQNVGSVPAFLSFTVSAPSASDGYIVIAPGLSFHDDTGSAHVWAKCYTGSTVVCGTLDPAGSETSSATIADGADIAEGARADVAYADTTGEAAGSVVSLIKGWFVLAAARWGSLTEAAPATDTASSGLNGRLQRIAQRITSLIALLPASRGSKAASASFSVVPGGLEYETVVAGQTAQALGATGAAGDYLSHLIVSPSTTSPGNVIILDGATPIYTFVGGASSVSNLCSIVIPVGAFSVSGAWAVTTGANVAVTGFGDFT